MQEISRADSCSRQAPPPTFDDHPDSPDNDIKICDASSPSDDCNDPPIVEDWNGDSSTCQDVKIYTQTSMEVGLPETPMDIGPNSIRDFDWTNPVDEACVAVTTNWGEVKSPKFGHPPNWSFPNPVKTRLPSPPAPEFAQCRFWKKANSIYARIFDYDKESILAANTVDSGALFKVVKDGWESLTPQERDNPVLQILEEVDQHLFWDLDPVTKIANLYKSHLILKVGVSNWTAEWKIDSDSITSTLRDAIWS